MWLRHPFGGIVRKKGNTMVVHDLALAKLVKILASDPQFSEETQDELKALDAEISAANGGE